MDPEVILLELESWLKAEVLKLKMNEVKSSRLRRHSDAGDSQSQHVTMSGILDFIKERRARKLN